MAQMFDLTGKTALVTGATGGFGAHFADVLAQAGAAVVLAARDPARLQPHVDDLKARGAQAFAVRLDVCDAQSVGDAFDFIGKDLGRQVDVLVNNAGVLQSGRFVDETDEGFRRLFETNVQGAIRVARLAARLMAARRSGSIINVASTAGLRSPAMLSTYGASKAALIHLTQTMALELAGKGVRVNALCPGNFDAGVHAALAAAGFEDNIRSRIPMRRLGALPELTGPLLLLASDAGSYMTGASLVVDGGQTLAWQ